MKPVLGAGGDGVPVEAGPALEITDGRWVYPTTADVPVGSTVRLMITATDRPGNMTVYEGEVTV